MWTDSINVDDNQVNSKVDAEVHQDQRWRNRTKQHRLPSSSLLPMRRLLRRSALDGMHQVREGSHVCGTKWYVFALDHGLDRPRLIMNRMVQPVCRGGVKGSNKV